MANPKKVQDIHKKLQARLAKLDPKDRADITKLLNQLGAEYGKQAGVKGGAAGWVGAEGWVGTEGWVGKPPRPSSTKKGAKKK